MDSLQWGQEGSDVLRRLVALSLTQKMSHRLLLGRQLTEEPLGGQSLPVSSESVSSCLETFAPSQPFCLGALEKGEEEEQGAEEEEEGGHTHPGPCWDGIFLWAELETK